VPFAPGGIADLTARAVAEQMARTLGQPVVVENRPSAGSIVASQAVANARPDGHTLLLMSNGNAVSVGLFKKLPYDTEKAFAPVSTLGFFDLGLFVPANSRFANLRDLVAHAKANPGKLNVGTIAVGSTQHLAAKLFETVAGIDAVVVPYKASPAVVTALRAGEIDLAFEVVGPMVSQVAAGAVRALAVSSAARNPAGRCGGLRRRLLERAGRPGGNPARGRRAAQPRRARGCGLAGRAGQARPARHASAGQHTGGVAGPARQRDQALGRGHPQGEDRSGVSLKPAVDRLLA
jgi:hypothetical protein